jgi:hypothetical protein
MNMVAEMLLHEPAPVAIWAVLWLATVPAMVVLASPAGVRNPGRALLDACTFLIGRPLRRRPVPEPAFADFFASDPASATGISYTGFAAEIADEGNPCAATAPAGGVLATPATSISRAAPVPAVAPGPASAATSADRAPLTNPFPAVSHPISADLSSSVESISGRLDAVSAPAGAAADGAAPAGPAADGEWADRRSPEGADHEAGRRSRLGRLLYRAAKRREERLRREAEAIRSVRYADEVRIAAESAGYAADRWQEHWEAAAERVDATFRAWQAADSRARRSRQAAAFHTPVTEQSPAEYADRERFLHLAVRAAAERGELPTSAVADALTGRGGWDARLHPVDQELIIQRASAAHLEAVWNRAVEAEARAWHDCQTSRRNWQSLCQEAILAEAHAATVHHLLPPEPVTAPPASHPVVVAQIA